jgi:selenide,water dikinase
LLGHLGNLHRASSAATPVGAELDLVAIPWFDGVLAFAEQDVCPGGSRRNLAYAAPNTRFASSVPAHLQLALADAQTSGGLLIAVAPDRHGALLEALEAHGVHVRATIGRIVPTGQPARIDVA